MPPDDRLVPAADRSVGKLLGEFPMRHVVLGHDHQARGILVQSMHDARPYGGIPGIPRYGVHPGQALYVGIDRFVLVVRLERDRAGADVKEQSIDQRTRPVTVRGVHHEPGGLVEYDEGGILEDDVERDVLRRDLDRRRTHHAAHEVFARLNDVRNPGDDDPGNRDHSFLDAPLNLGPRCVLHRSRQVHVEPLGPPVSGRNGHFDQGLLFFGFFHPVTIRTIRRRSTVRTDRPVPCERTAAPPSA